MLIKFSCDSTGSFTMLGEDALALVNLMKDKKQVEGILRGQDIDHALNQLRQRLRSRDTTPGQDTVASTEAGNGANGDEEEDEEPVDLAVRAVPLIEMLEAASASFRAGDKDSYVIWKPE